MTSCSQPGHICVLGEDGYYCATCGEGPVPPDHRDHVEWVRALEAKFGRDHWSVPEAEVLAYRAEWLAARGEVEP